MEKYIELFLTLFIGVIMLMTFNLLASGIFSLNPDSFQTFLLITIYMNILDAKHGKELL